MRAALEINRRSGYLAYGVWFEAHLGWLLRLAGRTQEALEIGRRAVATPVGGRHPWWRSTACLLLAGTLVEADARSEAADLLAEGLAAAEQDDSNAYLLGCRALLADVTGDHGSARPPPTRCCVQCRRLRARCGCSARSPTSPSREPGSPPATPSRAREVLAPLVAAARLPGLASGAGPGAAAAGAHCPRSADRAAAAEAARWLMPSACAASRPGHDSPRLTGSDQLGDAPCRPGRPVGGDGHVRGRPADLRRDRGGERLRGVCRRSRAACRRRSAPAGG